MPRPYFNQSIDDLEALFDSCVADRAILSQLRDELTHRRASRAKDLKLGVERRLTQLNREGGQNASTEAAAGTGPGEPPHPVPPRRRPRETRAEAGDAAANASNHRQRGADQGADDEAPDDRQRPETLTRIAGPGVAGKPDAYVPRLKSDLTIDLPAGSTRARAYVLALTALLKEMRKADKGSQRHVLENGKLVEAEGDRPLYTFPFPDRADLFEDTKVEIEADGRRRSGQLVSLADGKLLIALDEHLGPIIRRCILIIDNTALIEMLKERLDLADQGKIEISAPLADSVVDPDVAAPPVESVPAPEVAKLNAPQQAAVNAMLWRSVSYLWGPPGTGKTETLSAAVKALFEANKRILICSNTNQAVDQLIFKLCERLGHDNLALAEGKVIRAGRISLDKLEQYRDYVTVEGITERRSRDLNERKTEIEEQVAGLDQRAGLIRRDLDLFERVGKLYDEVSALRQQMQKRQADRQRAVVAVDQARKRAEQWRREHEELAAAGPLRRVFMRSAEKIMADIRKAEVDAERFEDAAADAEANATALEAKIVERDLLARETARALDGKDHQQLKFAFAGIEAEREPLAMELHEIARKLADVKASIIHGAQILGMTVTKATMSAREIGRFDTVIIDEASMVMLPALYFAAGLSTGRVVVSGDFRQLPPIVESEQQAIHDLIGRDVFAAARIDGHIKNDARLVMLTEQYRMTDDICRLIARPMYYGDLSVCPRRC